MTNQNPKKHGKEYWSNDDGLHISPPTPKESNLNKVPLRDATKELDEILQNFHRTYCDQNCTDEEIAKLASLPSAALHQYITRELKGLLNVVGENQDENITDPNNRNAVTRNEMRHTFRSAINEVIRKHQ